MMKLYRGRRTANSYISLYIVIHHITANNSPTAMPFTPGQSGNPLGRPKGSRNKTSLAVRDWSTAIVEDPKVQARLLADARAGRLHPSVMTALLAYAYGKPREAVTSEATVPVSVLEEARATLQVKLEHLRQTLHVTST